MIVYFIPVALFVAVVVFTDPVYRANRSARRAMRADERRKYHPPS